MPLPISFMLMTPTCLCFVHLLYVLDDFAHIIRIVGVLVTGSVHAGAAVVHANHCNFEPLVAGNLAQRRQAVNRRTTCADGLL